MKNIIVIAIISLVTIFSSNDLFAQKKSRDKISVQVDGLGCPFCAFGLEKKLKEIEGVKKIQIDMETGMTTFMAPSSLELSIKDIKDQVDKAGYTPMEVMITRADGTVVEAEKEEKEAVIPTSTIEFIVAGNCGMCKSRIERAALSIDGVATAVWDSENQLLELAYDEEMLENINEVKTKIAAVGHDTDETTANNDTYENLPPCCLYDRLAEDE